MYKKNYMFTCYMLIILYTSLFKETLGMNLNVIHLRVNPLDII